MIPLSLWARQPVLSTGRWPAVCWSRPAWWPRGACCVCSGPAASPAASVPPRGSSAPRGPTDLLVTFGTFMFMYGYVYVNLEIRLTIKTVKDTKRDLTKDLHPRCAKNP